MASISAGFGNLLDMFTYPLRHSHYLELVNPLWTQHVLKARVVGVWDDTADTRTLTLRPGRGWRSHRPGQFVRLGVPIDGMRHT
ncbi:ferredoxin reductase, partial [Flavobacterium cupreum]